MAPEFVLDTDAKRTKLIQMLEQMVKDDCISGRSFLEKAEQERTEDITRMGPKKLAVIKKNIDVRQAAFQQLIDDLRAHHAKDGMTLESFYRQFVLSVGQSLNDPAYTHVFFNAFTLKDLPENTRKQIGAISEAAGYGSQPIMMAFPMGTAMEDIELMQLRAITIERITEVAFNAFYQAATGEDLHTQRVASPTYKQFLAQAGRHLYGDTPGGSTHGF